MLGVLIGVVWVAISWLLLFLKSLKLLVLAYHKGNSLGWSLLKSCWLIRRIVKYFYVFLRWNLKHRFFWSYFVVKFKITMVFYLSLIILGFFREDVVFSVLFGLICQLCVWLVSHHRLWRDAHLRHRFRKALILNFNSLNNHFVRFLNVENGRRLLVLLNLFLNFGRLRRRSNDSSFA